MFATAFSFPSGNDSTAMKTAAAREIIKAGVRDFDFTAQTGYLLSGMERASFSRISRPWPTLPGPRGRRPK